MLLSSAGKVTAGLAESNRLADYPGFMTIVSSHLRADCLETRISSGPDPTLVSVKMKLLQPIAKSNAVGSLAI